MVLAAAVVMLGSGAAVAADGPPNLPGADLVGNVTGGDVATEPLQQSAEELHRINAKSAVADAWYARAFRDGSAAGLEEAVGRFRAAFGTAAAADLTSTTSTQPSSVSAMTVPSSGYVNLDQVAQVKSYYCGPASGMAMLRQLGKTTSAYDGKSLSQTNLASSTYLQTEANGATTWASDAFRKGVNLWRSGSTSDYYVTVSKPSASNFIHYLTYDISNNFSMAADAVELANGVHYNGHPKDLTIGHWLAAYQYTSSGSTVYWADPATSVWSSVQPYFSYSSTDFTNRFLQSNGVVW